MGVALMVAMVASAAYSAYSQDQAGRAQNKAAKYQAKLDEMRAAQAESQGYIEQRQADLKYGNVLSRAQVGMASSGVLMGQGSAADYNLSAADQHAIEKEIISRNAYSQEWGYKANATLMRYQGKMAQRSGSMNATGTMLEGVSNAAAYGTTNNLFGGSAPTITASPGDMNTGDAMGIGTRNWNTTNYNYSTAMYT